MKGRYWATLSGLMVLSAFVLVAQMDGLFLAALLLALVCAVQANELPW